MDVEILKQGLKEILNEDISIRTSIADLRRNVFLQSSKSEEKEAQIKAKEDKISQLSSEVDYIKNQLSLREQSMRDQIESLSTEKKELLDKLLENENQIVSLRSELEKFSANKAEWAKKSEEFNRLSMENSNYAGKIRELVEHIAKIQTAHESSQKEIESLKRNTSRKSESEQQISSLKKQIETLSGQLSSLQAENKTLIQENEAYSLRNAELTTRNAELESLNSALGSSSGILEAENLELKSLNAELQESNFEFINRHANLKLRSEETIEVLREEIVQLESTSADTIERLKSDLGNTVAENELLKEELVQIENTSAERITRLKDELSASLHNNDVLKEELVQLEATSAETIEKLKAELSAPVSGTEAEELTALLIESENENKVLKSVNEALKVVEQNYITAQQRITELEGVIGEIGVLRDSAEEVVALEAKAEMLNEEIDRITAELENVRAEFSVRESAMTNAAATLNDEIASLKNESIAWLEKEKMLTGRISELEQSLNELQQSSGGNDLLAEEISKLTAEMNVHLNAITEIEARNIALTGELLEKSAQLITATNERDAFLAECNRIKNELSEAEEVYNNLMESARAEFEKQVDSLKADAADPAELESLRGQIAALAEERDQLAGSVQGGGDAEKKVTELQILADELNSEKVRLEETITDLKRELFKAEEKLEKAESKENDEFIEGLFKKIDLLNEKTQKLQHQKEEMERQVPELLQKIAELSETIDIQKNNADKIREQGLEKGINSPNLAGLLAGSIKDKKSAKVKINELVREIDRCIAMLNAQS